MPTVSYGLGNPKQGSPDPERRPSRAWEAEWGPPEPLLLEMGGEGGLDISAASLACSPELQAGSAWGETLIEFLEGSPRLLVF